MIYLVVVSLMFQGAKEYYPNLSWRTFQKIGKEIISEVGSGRSLTLAQIDKRLRKKLKEKLGSPAKPFPKVKRKK